jgi:hypothetical protein
MSIADKSPDRHKSPVSADVKLQAMRGGLAVPIQRSQIIDTGLDGVR